MELKEIGDPKAGFKYQLQDDESLGTAFITLRLALKSWFCTYEPERYPSYKRLWANGGEGSQSESSREYCELYVQTIVHLQHFCELIFQSILRREHPLLADKAGNKDVVLYKLLKGQELSNDESNDVGSINFEQAEKRVFNLIKEKCLADHKELGFLNEYKKMFEVINNLRNRILHRGLFILKPEALDSLVAKFFLPFMNKLISLEPYSNYESHWKYIAPASGLDPIDEICIEAGQGKITSNKFKFFKELGRAAYFNPLHVIPERGVKKGFFPKPVENFLNGKIFDELASQCSSAVFTCPVCDVKGISQMYDYDTEYEGRWDEIKVNKSWVSDVVCNFCSFHITRDIGNPKDIGVQEIQDEWFTEVSIYKNAPEESQT